MLSCVCSLGTTRVHSEKGDSDKYYCRMCPFRPLQRAQGVPEAPRALQWGESVLLRAGEMISALAQLRSLLLRPKEDVVSHTDQSLISRQIRSQL